MCAVVGDEGRRVENLQIEILKNEVEQVLKTTFQNKLKKWQIKTNDESKCDDIKAIFRPTNVHVCKWNEDPRYFGAYSVALTGCFQKQ